MQKIGNDSNLDDAFPRWMATTKLINPHLREKNTSAVAIIGVKLFKFTIKIGVLKRERYWSCLGFHDICTSKR
jgi:hypothetical protein